MQSMHRREFFVRVLVVILGVHTFAWALSVGITPQGDIQRAPITPQGIEAQSLSAGVAGAVISTSTASTSYSTRSQFIAQ